MDLKTYISQLRKDIGISQRELARRANISHAEISRIEKGERNQPNPTLLKKLAPVLGVKTEQLMEAAGYIKAREKDASKLDETDYKRFQYEFTDHQVPILCKEDGTASAYLDLAQLCQNIDFALRVVDNQLFSANIYNGDLVLCKLDADFENARVLVMENVSGNKRTLKLRLNPSADLPTPSECSSNHLPADSEWHVIGSVIAVLRNIEGKPPFDEDPIIWQEIGKEAKKMGFTPDQVKWLLQSQRQFLKKYYTSIM